MKVRIAYTVDVCDEIRRAINNHYGRPGLASREEVKSWYEAFGESMNDDLSMWADDEADRKEDVS